MSTIESKIRRALISRLKRSAGSIAEKLEAVIDSKEGIRTSINDKGVEVSTSVPLNGYAGKIDEISGGVGEIEVVPQNSPKWEKFHDWPDIDAIFKAQDMPNAKCIVLINDQGNTTNFNSNNLSGEAFIHTSDGKLLTYSGYSIDHKWDTSKDIVSTDGHGYRWYIIEQADEDFYFSLCGITSAVWAKIYNCNLRCYSANRPIEQSNSHTSSANFLQSVEISENVTASEDCFLGTLAYGEMGEIFDSGWQTLPYLEKVMFPEGLVAQNEHYMSHWRGMLLANLERLHEVVLPTTIRILPYGIFQRNYLLDKINLDFIEIYEQDAMAYTGIKDLKIGEYCTYIESGFNSCHQLTRVHIPKSVIYANHAFRWDHSLKYVHIEDGADISSGASMFANCTGLEKLDMKSTRTIQQDLANGAHSLGEFNIEVAILSTRALYGAYGLRNSTLRVTQQLHINALTGIHLKHLTLAPGVSFGTVTTDATTRIEKITFEGQTPNMVSYPQLYYTTCIEIPPNWVIPGLTYWNISSVNFGRGHLARFLVNLADNTGKGAITVRLSYESLNQLSGDEKLVATQKNYILAS